MRNKIIFEKETIEQILSQTNTKADAAKILNISTTTLRLLAKELSIDYKTKSFRKGKTLPKQHPEIDKQWLIDNWVNTNKSMRQLAKEFGVSEGLIDARRAKYKLSKTYKYKVNTRKLYNLDDPKVYYLAGLLATDGWLNKKNPGIEISLTGESEKQLLNEIKNYFETSAEIALYGNSYRLRIAEKDIVKFFSENFNIPTSNKTFLVDIPRDFPSEDCAKAYIRGCFDGDGYISENKQCGISLCTASEKFVLGIQSVIEKYSGEKIPYHLTRRGDKYYPCIGTTDRKSRAILDWMYSLDDCFKLERKYNRYIKLKIQSEQRNNAK